MSDCGPAPRRDRLYFALLPDGTAATRMVGLARQIASYHTQRARLTSAERLHLSLFGIADRIPEQRAIEAGHDIAARLPSAPFLVTLDHAGPFGKRLDSQQSPIVLYATNGGDEALNAFRRAFCRAAADAGLGLSRAAFVPHVTLLYDEVRPQGNQVEPIGWRVCDFVLIRSLHGRSRHDHLGRWTLGSRSPVSPDRLPSHNMR